MAAAGTAEWEDAARGALRDAGHRAGGAREAVVGFLGQSELLPLGAGDR